MTVGELRLVSPEFVPSSLKQRIMDEIPNVRWHALPTDFPTSEDLRNADVYFGLLASHVEIPQGRLRWIQYPFAGVPGWLCQQAAVRQLTITNASGIYDRTISEHTVGVMIAFARRFDYYFQSKNRREWAHPIRPAICDLAGSTAAILGMGSLGQAIARQLKSLGVRVVGCRRSSKPTPYADAIYRADQLCEMVRRTDWLIIAAPLTRETRGMVSRDVLSAMPRGARVINVGRGPILDHGALVELLADGQLAGAALDVTSEEPLRPDDPLWDLPNVLLTQHSSCNPADASPAAGELFLRNLHRFVAGEPLENAVDLVLGY